MSSRALSAGWKLSNLPEWLAALPKPAAVFAAFDLCAATVLETCRELRINVPTEIAVIGVDDDSLICEHTRPKLTSIRPDHERQGYAAAQELDKLMSRRRGKADVIIIPHIGITVRDSTTHVPQGMRIVRDTNTYLDGHALSPIRVAAVVAHLGVSERLANRHYSQIAGHSIQEEIIIRRLAEAKRLLAKTDMPMSRIAKRCGFKSQIILAHLFSKRIGMSMSTYRAQSIAKNA